MSVSLAVILVVGVVGRSRDGSRKLSQCRSQRVAAVQTECRNGIVSVVVGSGVVSRKSYVCDVCVKRLRVVLLSCSSIM